MRRRRSLLLEAALVVLALCIAAVTAGAQVSATGDGGQEAQLEPTPTPRPPGRGRVSSGGDVAVETGARLTADLAADADGDDELSGSVDLVVNPRRGSLCFDIDLDAETDEAENVVAVHIHPGLAGAPCDEEDCAPPIDLDYPNEGLEGCVRAGRHLLSSLVLEPEQFFLHVHTGRFPAGAASGQLAED